MSFFLYYLFFKFLFCFCCCTFWLVVMFFFLPQQFYFLHVKYSWICVDCYLKSVNKKKQKFGSLKQKRFFRQHSPLHVTLPEKKLVLTQSDKWVCVHVYFWFFLFLFCFIVGRRKKTHNLKPHWPLVSKRIQSHSFYFILYNIFFQLDKKLFF